MTIASIHSALRRTMRHSERWLIVAVIVVMALLPAVEAITRRVGINGIPGSLLYTQHLTLWIGFVGALIATGSGKHLALASGALLPEAWRAPARLYVGALSAAVTAMLAYASVVLVRADASMPRSLPGGVPEWMSEVIMPVTLALMAMRFVWHGSDSARGRLGALAIATGMVAVCLWPGAQSWFIVPASLAILAGLLLGAPVFVAMAGMAMALFFGDGTPIASVPAETYRLVASATLPAIPLLTAAGYVLAQGGASKRLLRLARALVGWLPGGMALMVTLVCAAFTTFTGGSGVTILALGGLMLPLLTNERYSRSFGIGLITSAGSLGLLFPPSLPVILYAVVAHQRVEDLFIAGFVPGLLLVTIVSLYAVAVGVRIQAPRHEFALREAGLALWGAKWELGVGIVVVASIFTGFATMVEAAALALVGAIASQSFVFRDIDPWRALPRVLVNAATLVGAVVILLGVAMGLTSYLVDAEIPAAVLAWTRQHISSPLTFLLVLNLALLVLGSVLEIFSAIVILAPLLAPLAIAYGIDPLHLGVVFLANMELGFLFPPMGLNLILASTRFERPLTELYRVTWPYLAIRAVGVLVITYAPVFTTGVLAWVRGW